MAIKVSVKQGRVHVNSIQMVLEAPGVVVLSADLGAKGAEVFGVSDDVVYLNGFAHLQRGKPAPTRTPDLAEIQVRCFPDQRLDATVGRYAVRIYVLDNAQTKRRQLWTDSDSSRRLGANKAAG